VGREIKRDSRWFVNIGDRDVWVQVDHVQFDSVYVMNSNGNHFHDRTGKDGAALFSV